MENRNLKHSWFKEKIYKSSKMPLKSGFTFWGFSLVVITGNYGEYYLIIEGDNDIFHYFKFLISKVSLNCFYRVNSNAYFHELNLYTPPQSLSRFSNTTYLVDNNSSVTNIEYNIAIAKHNIYNHIFNEQFNGAWHMVSQNLPIFMGLVGMLGFTLIPTVTTTINNLMLRLSSLSLVVQSVGLVTISGGLMYLHSPDIINLTYNICKNINLSILINDTKDGLLLSTIYGIGHYIYNNFNTPNIDDIKNKDYKYEGIYSNPEKFVDKITNSSILSSIYTDTDVKVFYNTFQINDFNARSQTLTNLLLSPDCTNRFFIQAVVDNRDRILSNIDLMDVLHRHFLNTWGQFSQIEGVYAQNAAGDATFQDIALHDVNDENRERAVQLYELLTDTRERISGLIYDTAIGLAQNQTIYNRFLSGTVPHDFQDIMPEVQFFVNTNHYYDIDSFWEMYNEYMANQGNSWINQVLENNQPPANNQTILDNQPPVNNQATLDNQPPVNNQATLGNQNPGNIQPSSINDTNWINQGPEDFQDPSDNQPSGINHGNWFNLGPADFQEAGNNQGAINNQPPNNNQGT